ncbi:MAG: glutamate dehydrogenase [Vicingaceae bacterium]|nr:MAG: glutamate dehydrogenase [Vicingaceae bacterium]
MSVAKSLKSKINDFLNYVEKRNPNEPEFLQAVKEVAETIIPFIEENPQYKDKMLLERMVEPERVVMFRVPWVDDKGNIHVNRGFRVQMNSAIGPYKGGIRFHPSVNLSKMKFLAFEQTFKNALTTLPLGGGKGGSDFDPRGRSELEIMRFCYSFMNELYRHIGPDSDVPAGDIGVGIREIGFMFAQYKKITNNFHGVFTGKGLSWGGSLIRPEATGFGAVYFAREVMKFHGEDIAGKTVAVSGFGNVAWGVVQKLNEVGAKVLTISGPDGFVYDKDGIKGEEKIEFMREMRASNRDRVKDFADKFGVEFYPNKRPWVVKCDIAMPCATENELNLEDAKELVKNKVKFVCEVANMPTTYDAYKYLTENNVIFVPGKAANAGGVAVSGLEMTQNAMHLSWSREEVDTRLKDIMSNIHFVCVMHGKEKKNINYVKGANIAGFIKVADAMLDQGVV